MRKIQLTEEDKLQILKDFEQNILQNIRLDSEKISYSTTIKPKEDTPKAQINFTSEAYCKMLTLIIASSKEIAWHGTVERNENNFLITDIMMYPQEIAAATVTSNDEKYPMWLMQQPDEIFNKLRFQGHSHVNFGSFPSNTDSTLYGSMLQELQDNDFYIFFIMNKKYEIWSQIYDLANNLVYETNDIEIGILTNDGKTTMHWFAEQSAENIIERKTETTTTLSTINPKITSRQWRYDYTAGTYVPTRANQNQIDKILKKARKEYKDRTDYLDAIVKAFDALQSEFEAEDLKELENLAIQKEVIRFTNKKERNNKYLDCYAGDY